MNPGDRVTQTTYRGWLRLPHGRWRAVVTGPDADEVRTRLYAAAERHQSSDTVILASDADPNVRRPRRPPVDRTAE